jgi:tetratricopeptide (TPR) repeat protein
MKRISRFTGLLMLLLVLSMGVSHGSENTRLFLDGISEFENGNYTGATEKFLQVAESGVKNGSLYYNLGNAYLKAGDLGKAVLWYNRALALIPNDPDLKFNLAYARSLVKDIAEDEKASVFRIIFFWKYLLSDKTVKWTAVILNGILWLGMLILLFIGRRPSRILLGTAGLAVLIFITTAGVNTIEKRIRHSAVILPETAAVMSAPTEDATELFKLHAGTCVSIEQQGKGYIKIYFSKGKIGWIKKDHVGIV